MNEDIHWTLDLLMATVEKGIEACGVVDPKKNPDWRLLLGVLTTVHRDLKSTKVRTPR